MYTSPQSFQIGRPLVCVQHLHDQIEQAVAGFQGQLCKDRGELRFGGPDLTVVHGIPAGVVIPQIFQNGFRLCDAAFGFIGGDGG